MLRAIALIALLLAFPFPTQAADPDYAGAWRVSVRFADGATAATLELRPADGGYTGASGPLDENGYFPLTYKGALNGRTLELDATGGGDLAGHLSLTLKDGRLAGSGTLYGVPVELVATRPPTAGRAPKTWDYAPTQFHLRFSPAYAPALRIASGDTVRTETLDNEGRDGRLRRRGMPGNTLTGPFFVEGAMPGDTLVVHLVRVRTNRSTASMYSSRLSPVAVLPWHEQSATAAWDRIWTLDAAAGEARPAKPSDALKDFHVPLKPMIGSLGVAPAQQQAISASDVGFHGGNLDYGRITEGATLYFPVFQEGALFSLGDGHAAQGDGEITGQGLETSLEVEFTVEVIPGHVLRQPWFEDADYVMVSGVGNTLDQSLQLATSGLAQWLKSTYGLTDSEVALVLGAAVEYDIAEVVDPRPHVVAKIRKDRLALIRKPS